MKVFLKTTYMRRNNIFINNQYFKINFSMFYMQSPDADIHEQTNRYYPRCNI